MVSIWSWRKEILNSDWWSMIPPISRKWTITSHLQKFGRVKQDNGIITLPSWKLDLQWQHMYTRLIKKPAYIDKDKTSHHMQHRNVFMENMVLNSLCLYFFHLLAQKPNLEKFSICLNNFTHNFHLSESSFTCPRLRVSGLTRRLIEIIVVDL